MATTAVDHPQSGTVGLPYAPAGYNPATGNATATCPCCGTACEGRTPKAAARAYARHYVA